jgi:hypothetical protein
MKLEILFTETLNNAISCNMDIATIINLKNTHKRQIENNFKWFGYESWLQDLNKNYLVNKKVPCDGY